MHIVRKTGQLTRFRDTLLTRLGSAEGSLPSDAWRIFSRSLCGALRRGRVGWMLPPSAGGCQGRLVERKAVRPALWSARRREQGGHLVLETSDYLTWGIHHGGMIRYLVCKNLVHVPVDPALL